MDHIHIMAREVDSLRAQLLWAGREERIELERKLAVAERNLKAARDARDKAESHG